MFTVRPIRHLKTSDALAFPFDLFMLMIQCSITSKSVLLEQILRLIKDGIRSSINILRKVGHFGKQFP